MCSKKPDVLAGFEQEEFAWPEKTENAEEAASEDDPPSEWFFPVEDEFLTDGGAGDYDGPVETADKEPGCGGFASLGNGEECAISTSSGRASGMKDLSILCTLLNFILWF